MLKFRYDFASITNFFRLNKLNIFDFLAGPDEMDTPTLITASIASCKPEPLTELASKNPAAPAVHTNLTDNKHFFVNWLHGETFIL